jgi:WD40 repeat protein
MLNNRDCKATLEGHGSSVRAIAFSYNSKKPASTPTRDIKIWHVGTEDCDAAIRVKLYKLYSIAFAHGPKVIAWIGSGSTIFTFRTL